MTIELAFIFAVVLCATAGAVGYILGRRLGEAEGFINGSASVLLQSDSFISVGRIAARGGADDAENDEQE